MDGNELYWLTTEDPEKWQVVVRSRDNEYEQFDEQITSFLAKLFKREILSALRPDEFFADPKNIRFVPKSSEPVASAYLQNIYEIYVDNGNGAGFWVRSQRDQPGFTLFIRLVNGKVNGELPGIPNEYGRPPVIADLYLGDKLLEKDMKLRRARLFRSIH